MTSNADSQCYMKFDWEKRRANQIPCKLYFSAFDVIMKKVLYAIPDAARHNYVKYDVTWEVNCFDVFPVPIKFLVEHFAPHLTLL